MYFDTAYIAKYYCNEPDSAPVRELVDRAPQAVSSIWALAEFNAVLHRHIRQKSLSAQQARFLNRRFELQAEMGLWKLLPVGEILIRKTSSSLLAAPSSLFLRAGDAIHLQTARDAGETEIWSNDRHMLAAASYFGLKGRSI